MRAKGAGNAALFALATAATLLLGAVNGEAAPNAAATLRTLYAVNEAPNDRGSISVYDIDAGHRPIKIIKTATDVSDVRGVAASAVTGRLYAAYRDGAGTGRVYCLDIYKDRIVWDKAIAPGVDRLTIDPNGRLLYVPIGEGGTAGYINVVDAGTGAPVRRVWFSQRSHDAQYPLSGPLFQETKARDGSGNYLYLIDPRSYAVSRIGPYSGILGPYAVDGTSRYVVNDVTNLWGMQVADLRTGRIVTVRIPAPPPARVALLHGIGWTPDQTEVWQNSIASDPHVYVWDMRDPMTPVLQQTLSLRSGRGSHWLTFTIKGDYAYIAPDKKDRRDGTEIFDARRHASVGMIGSSEEMLEIDFAGGGISRVGDQYGIGRR